MRGHLVITNSFIMSYGGLKATIESKQHLKPDVSSIRQERKSVNIDCIFRFQWAALHIENLFEAQVSSRGDGLSLVPLGLFGKEYNKAHHDIMAWAGSWKGGAEATVYCLICLLRPLHRKRPFLTPAGIPTLQASRLSILTFALSSKITII